MSLTVCAVRLHENILKTLVDGFGLFFFFFLQAGGFGKNYKDDLFALFLYALVFIWQGWAEK